MYLRVYMHGGLNIFKTVVVEMRSEQGQVSARIDDMGERKHAAPMF
jgi:hypothetical protein